MSLWAVGKQSPNCLAAAKDRTYLWPHRRLLPAGLPGWTLDLAHPLTVAGVAHGPRYQPRLVQPPGNCPHGWRHGDARAGHLWSQLACPEGIAAAAWQTWGRQVAPWQFIGSTDMVGVRSVLVTIPGSVDNPSRKVISSWVRWVPPKEWSGLQGWILRNSKNQTLVLVVVCGWCTCHTGFLVTWKKGWSALFCTQMDC